MSLIEQFFEEYDNLMIEQGGVETFWRGITNKKICQYIRKARRDKRMPPPKRGRRRERRLSSQMHLERAWALGA